MADRKISDLPVATAANDADAFHILQGGVDKQAGGDKVRAPCLLKANNLSDVASVSTARTNLGVAAASATLLKADNLSGLANAGTARTNLGLGTAAVATLGTGSGQVPTANQIDGLLTHGSQVFAADGTFTVPNVSVVYFDLSGGGGGGGGGGGTGGSNDGTDGNAGGNTYIEDDATNDILAGDTTLSFGAGGGGGKDSGYGGTGGQSYTAPGQNGATGRSGVTGAPGGYGGGGPFRSADDSPLITSTKYSKGGTGGTGASGAGGGGGGGAGARQMGRIDTSARQGDVWNINVGAGGTGGAHGSGGGSNGTDGLAGFVVLWW